MDRRGVQATTKKKSGVKKRQQHVKVVYIANPKMVRTNASNFRALVQELTGNTTTRPTPLAAMEFPDPDHSPQLSEGSDLDRSPQISKTTGYEDGNCNDRSPQISETTGYEDGDYNLLKDDMEAGFEPFPEFEFDYTIESFNEIFSQQMLDFPALISESTHE